MTIMGLSKEFQNSSFWAKEASSSKYKLLQEEQTSSSTSLPLHKHKENIHTLTIISTAASTFSKIWILHMILFMISGAVLLYSILKLPSKSYCIEKLSPYSPGLHIFQDVDKVYRFDVGYNSHSSFRGPPSPERDAVWDRITHVGAMSISEETRQKINASDGSVRLPKESGGGFMAMTEFVHEMHCIDRLWKHTYPDYYMYEYNHTIESPEDWHEHADHCAEILRQKVMCNADITVVTYNWLKNHESPHPNFNSQHKCRDFDAALEWAIANQAPPPKEGKVYRPTDGTHYFEYDDLPFDPRKLS
ncbi:hypothetical protein BCIN_12g06100 [Botrytis cinerea B05.10]|uniref:Tat pathway signal sequence protein n=2 Tax=Botryotinia fuckeliana TaxID=40559 RepID=A0A384JZQ2_BOTFB|nr:hypothetical protein BCIN_12g06100 [Botrytis cinerea B05.10]ATZ56076.1 hypothetical protein BCIN_12g06100 [Botrytis cinerea B05.10]